MKRLIGLTLISFFLIGCEEDYTLKVKSDPAFNYSALRYGEVLDNRKLCEETHWKSEKVRNTPTVTYTCRLRNDKEETLTEEIIWENSRAMNGFALRESRLIQVDRSGHETIYPLDPARFMYGAVYDLIDMDKYRALHFNEK